MKNKYRVIKDGDVYRIQLFRREAVIVWHKKRGFWNELFNRKWSSAEIREYWINCAFPIPNPEYKSVCFSNDIESSFLIPTFSEVSSWDTLDEAEAFFEKLAKK